MEFAHHITRKDVESIGAKIYATTRMADMPSNRELEERGWARLGYNAGIYGWNWTAWLSKNRTTVLMAAYRNAPKSATYIDGRTASRISLCASL